MGKINFITDEERAKIKEMLAQGISCADISKITGRAEPTIRRLRREFGYPPVYRKESLINDQFDADKYKWLLENWHFKIKNPVPKSKRKVEFRTPYNFEQFKRRENNR